MGLFSGKKSNNVSRPFKSKLVRGISIGFKTIIYSIITVLVLILGINAFVCLSAAPNMYETDENFDYSAECIVVLGCGVNGYKPSLMLSDRLDTAIELYKKGVAPKLLMSGDHGEQYYNEVGVMKAYAMEKGVPSSDIFMDHAGFSTYESLYRAKKVYGIKKIVAVTQEYHLYRTVYVGESLGLEIKGVASLGDNYAGQNYRDVREIFARDKDFLNTILKPAPKINTDKKIDITGDGNVTNDDAFNNIANKKGLN